MIIPNWAGYLRWRDAFVEAMDPDFYTVEYLDKLVLNGAEVFLGEHAAIIVEVRDYPGGARVAHGLVGAGRIEDIIGDLIPEAESWAKSAGCTHATIESRSGWQRVMKSHGYEPHQLAVIKAL